VISILETPTLNEFFPYAAAVGGMAAMTDTASRKAALGHLRKWRIAGLPPPSELIHHVEDPVHDARFRAISLHRRPG
jgi:hypothetical protein